MSHLYSSPLPVTLRDSRELQVDARLMRDSEQRPAVVSAPLLQALAAQGSKFFVDAKDLAPHFQPERTKDWTVSDLYDHLLSLGVAKEDARLLRAQQVDGRNLLYVNDVLLEKWGVDTWGKRMAIIQVLQSLVFKGDLTSISAKSYDAYTTGLGGYNPRYDDYSDYDQYSDVDYHEYRRGPDYDDVRARYVDPFAATTPLHGRGYEIERERRERERERERARREKSRYHDSTAPLSSSYYHTRSRSRSHSRSRAHSHKLPLWAEKESTEMKRRYDDRRRPDRSSRYDLDRDRSRHRYDRYGLSPSQKDEIYHHRYGMTKDDRERELADHEVRTRDIARTLERERAREEEYNRRMQELEGDEREQLAERRRREREAKREHDALERERRYRELRRKDPTHPLAIDDEMSSSFSRMSIEQRERAYRDREYRFLERERDRRYHDLERENEYHDRLRLRDRDIDREIDLERRSRDGDIRYDRPLDDEYDSDADREYYHPRIHGYHRMYQRQFEDRTPLTPSRTAPVQQPWLEDFYKPADVRNRQWLSGLQPPSTQLRNNPSQPEQKLKLEWVYGYRSFDSRNNLIYNNQGDIIYPVASVVVVYKARTRQQRHFQGHNDEVRCIAQHPVNQNIIASGQNATFAEDALGVPPHICVWDSTDFGKNWILKLEKQDKAIRSLTFSSDGKYLVSISNDAHHTLKLWDWESRTLLGTSRGDSNPIYHVRWNHRDPTEFVTVGKHHAVFWRFDGVKLTARRAQVHGKNLTFYSIAFSEKGYICLGCENGGIYVFANGVLVREFPKLHRGKIFTLDAFPGGLISGGGDGVVNLLDKKLDIIRSFQFHHRITSIYSRANHLLVGTQGSQIFEIVDFLETPIAGDEGLEPIVQGHYDGELHAMCVSPGGREVITAGEDNQLCVWEMTTHRLLRRAPISDKPGKPVRVLRGSTASSHPQHQCARSIAVSPNGKHIVVGLNNGEVAIFSSADLRKLYIHDLNQYSKRYNASQRHHPHFIPNIKFSPSGNTVAIGTHGSVIVLMDVRDEYRVKGVLKGHESFITQLDWSEDSQFLQSTDGQYHLLYHHIYEDDLAASVQIGDYRLIRDVKWANQSCLLGWSVQGILETGEQEGYLINSLEVSPSRNLVISGDDAGQVQLFRYPVLEKGHTSHAYHSHSSHVVNVRWSCDEKYVISLGGHDLSMMQWSVV